MINEGLVYAFLLVVIRGSDLLVKHERFLDLLAANISFSWFAFVTLIGASILSIS